MGSGHIIPPRNPLVFLHTRLPGFYPSATAKSVLRPKESSWFRHRFQWRHRFSAASVSVAFTGLSVRSGFSKAPAGKRESPTQKCLAFFKCPPHATSFEAAHAGSFSEMNHAPRRESRDAADACLVVVRSPLSGETRRSCCAG